MPTAVSHQQNCVLQKQRVSFTSRVFVLWRFHRKNVKEPWSYTVTLSNKVRFFIPSIQYGGGFERVNFNQCAREATGAKGKGDEGAETVSSRAIASRISLTASLIVGLLKALAPLTSFPAPPFSTYILSCTCFPVMDPPQLSGPLLPAEVLSAQVKA